AELRSLVIARAVRRPEAGEPACVIVAWRRGHEPPAPGDGLGGRAEVTGEGAATELAEQVQAPAVGGPGAREPTGMSGARGEGAETQTPRDENRRWDAHIILRGIVTELAGGVIAPAIRRPGTREPTGKPAARGKGAEAEAT